MRDLLRRAAQDIGVGIVVVTCGIKQVWQNVLDHQGFANITVIGNGRLQDPIVTPETKADVVNHMRRRGIYVSAFGDSPLDIPMLKAADCSIVVVGQEGFRSTTMNEALSTAITNEGLVARQVSVKTRDHRLDYKTLPIIDLEDEQTLRQLLQTGDSAPARLRIWQPNAPTANLLATPMRNADVSGHSLQRAHREVGRYLASAYLPQILGLESFDIPHVQGNTTKCFRIRDESSTLVVGILRGGEPMAFGVSEVLPNAAFSHAKEPSLIDPEVLKRSKTIILVDSVINTGRSIEQFLHFLLPLERESGMDSESICQPGVDIVIVTGVLQEDAAHNLKQFCERRQTSANVNLVTLRTSSNTYKGEKGTDTGNRLFNTTHVT